MPAKSKKQFNFMKGVASGSIRKPGLSKEEADEYTAGQSSKKLPFKAGKGKPKKKKRPVAFGKPY